MIKKQILLASTSPRRKEILDRLHIDYLIRPSEVDERIINHKNPIQLVKSLALLKANAIKPYGNSNQIILGADTVVVYKNHILGKPSNAIDVSRYLSELSGKNHKVITAIALIDIEQGKTIVDYAITKVKFKHITTRDIDAYIQSKEPFDKAGAYGIQGIGASFVKSIKGDYNNVVGLPIGTLISMFSQLDYDYFEDFYQAL